MDTVQYCSISGLLFLVLSQVSKDENVASVAYMTAWFFVVAILISMTLSAIRWGLACKLKSLETGEALGAIMWRSIGKETTP